MIQTTQLTPTCLFYLTTAQSKLERRLNLENPFITKAQTRFQRPVLSIHSQLLESEARLSSPTNNNGKYNLESYAHHIQLWYNLASYLNYSPKSVA